MVALLVLALSTAVLAGQELPPTQVQAGFNIGVGINPTPTCPTLEQNRCDSDEIRWEPEGSNEAEVNVNWGKNQGSVCYFVDTTSDGVTSPLEDGFLNGDYGRSYAFEGETIHFRAIVKDKGGIVENCDKVVVTLDNGVDPQPAACSLIKTMDDGTRGLFDCEYTVQSADHNAADFIQGTYWVSVQVMGGTCSAQSACQPIKAAGLISLYLNPAVSLTLATEPGTQFGFGYDVDGNVLDASEITPGATVYSPFFTIENSAEQTTGLYIGLMLYGKDMHSVGSTPAKCPEGNVLEIDNVKYMASHLNAQQDWTTMPRVQGLVGTPELVFTGSPLANILGVGDDVTMRLLLHIPNPCQGQFDNGQIVFIGYPL